MTLRHLVKSLYPEILYRNTYSGETWIEPQLVQTRVRAQKVEAKEWEEVGVAPGGWQ
jgi:hypothetical protein